VGGVAGWLGEAGWHRVHGACRGQAEWRGSGMGDPGQGVMVWGGGGGGPAGGLRADGDAEDAPQFEGGRGGVDRVNCDGLELGARSVASALSCAIRSVFGGPGGVLAGTR
jgi:hypothetical protein